MWFLLGIVSLTGFALFFVRWRAANRWKGTQRQLLGQVYESALLKSKNRTKGVLIGLTCNTALEFCLKQETFVDRIFKRLGLSQEQQLNHLHFDEKVYIVSDNPRLGALLKGQPDLPAVLENLFEPNRFKLGVVCKLWCQQRRLWVQCKTDEDFDVGDIEALAKEVLPVLVKVHDALLATSEVNERGQDYFIPKALVLLGVSSALLVNGVIQSVRVLLLKFPVQLESLALLKMALMLGGIMTAALILWCVIWLGRTSRTHLVLMEILLVGSFGSVLTAATELRDYNIEFDHSRVRYESVQVVQYYTTRCGKRNRSTCYNVKLAPFVGKAGGLKLSLSYDAYNQLKNHPFLVLPVHEGALGVPWIEAPRAP
ncbi:hypothetical protein HDN1F_06600 [gamma proteobacterium HdN1]|nr:hypothetical protein HDN1F_06600 [gamma proteobacterium HdN1]